MDKLPEAEKTGSGQWGFARFIHVVSQGFIRFITAVGSAQWPCLWCQDDKAVKQRRATVPYGFMQGAPSDSHRGSLGSFISDSFPWQCYEQNQPKCFSGFLHVDYERFASIGLGLQPRSFVPSFCSSVFFSPEIILEMGI